MKSCCFAGDNDEFVLSGSDDFNLYVWRVNDADRKTKLILAETCPYYHFLIFLANDTDQWVDSNQMVLYGHRSIVNQVRYNSQKCLIASSGVEKIVKLWSPFKSEGWSGSLIDEATGPENPREVFSNEEYFSLVS